MKKIVVAFCAALAVFACSKEQGNPLTEVKYPQSGIEPEQITFDLSAVVTKAVKADWENGDVVYIFFSGVNAPKYLKITYNDGAWTSVEMNGASTGSLGLNNNDTGTMRAIHLPFANDATVTADGGSFKFSTTNYPYYMTATLAYTVVDNKVSGTFDMAIPEGFVQFFVKDNTDIASLSNGDYTLATDAVYPVSINSISADVVTVNETSGDAGDALRGYVFNTGNISTQGHLFAGKLADIVSTTKTTDVLKSQDGTSNTIGNTDYTSGYFGTTSSFVNIPSNSRLHVEFTNYTKGENAWQNFLVLVSNAGLGTAGYKEFVALYANRYGWLDGIRDDVNHSELILTDAVSHIIDWGNQVDNMKGAKVEVDIDNVGEGATRKVYMSFKSTNSAQTNTDYMSYDRLVGDYSVGMTLVTDNSYYVANPTKCYTTPIIKNVKAFSFGGAENGFGYYFTLTNTSTNNTFAFFKHKASALASHAAINLPAVGSTKWIQTGVAHGVEINGVTWATVNYGATTPSACGSELAYNTADLAAGGWNTTDWEVPSEAQMAALKIGTDMYWTTVSGNSGYVFVDSDATDKFVFLPAIDGVKGKYWSNTLAHTNIAKDLIFTNNIFYTGYTLNTELRNVRPVHK